MSAEPTTSVHETLAARVGARLRARRRELRRTLAEVAAEAAVSVSYLSAVEKGTNMPSLPTLARIVHALGLMVADVVRDEGQNRVRLDRLDPDAPGATPVSHDELQLRVAFLVAGAGEEGECPVELGGREVFVFVQRGTLIVRVGGEEHTLRLGDALDAVAPGEVTWRDGGTGSVSVWASGGARARS